MTRVCVVGAGAIGGYLASRLAGVPGIALTVLARGAQLAAIRRGGLRILEDGSETRVALDVHDVPAPLGAQDVLLVCLKAHALVEAAPTLAPLVGPHTVIVPAINGVPWWFLEACGGALAGRRLASVDPEGTIARVLPPSQVLGCVLHMASAQAGPGTIHKGSGRVVILGRPACNPDSAVESRVAALFAGTGLDLGLSPRICDEVWSKLWGNMTMNPISALTRSTCDVILDDPLTNRLTTEVMLEAARIGTALGIDLDLTPAQRCVTTRTARPVQVVDAAGPRGGPEARGRGAGRRALRDRAARRAADAVAGMLYGLSRQLATHVADGPPGRGAAADPAVRSAAAG